MPTGDGSVTTDPIPQYCIVQVKCLPGTERDLMETVHNVEEHLLVGMRFIALDFETAQPPYSRYISLLSRCSERVAAARGSLAAIIAEPVLRETVTDTGLSELVTVVTTAAELDKLRGRPAK
jgi:hypothetical protein